MSRALYVSLAVLLFAAPYSLAGDPKTESAPIIGAGAIAPDAPPARVVWNAPAHKLYFNYQRYLLTLEREAETQVTWEQLTPTVQAKKLRETEAFLTDKLAEVTASTSVSPEDMNLVKAVWGGKVAGAVAAVASARESGDPAKIKTAVAQAASLAKTVGGANVNWNAVFDGKQTGPDESFDADPKSVEKDYLAVPKKTDFVESLSSPETAKILASQKSYAAFLREKNVSPEAVPGLLAMYQVLSGPPTASSREIAHLLPTVVSFLNDGKHVVYDRDAPKDAFGMAVPGDYDRPEAVKLTPLVMGADPVAVGNTLAHEFQHIYDMYTGRYYTLDSEMRGFKVDVMFFKTLKERNPGKYQSLVTSDNDDTRSYMQDAISFTRDYDTSPVAFREAISSRYQKRSQGGFSGRMSLRDTVNPQLESGAVVDLATERSRLEVSKREVAELEERQARISRQYLDNTASRDLARELEKATTDLTTARRARDRKEGELTIKQIRLKRMQSEVAWMDKNAAAKGRQPDAHDLVLAVDRDYIPK